MAEVDINEFRAVKEAEYLVEYAAVSTITFLNPIFTIVKEKDRWR